MSSPNPGPADPNVPPAPLVTDGKVLATQRLLGCKPSDPNKMHRALRMGYYLNSAVLPTPPPQTNWLAKLTPINGSYGMMLNDQIGCCTSSGKGHCIQTLTANATQELTVTDQDVLADYIAVTGFEGAAYDPSSGVNDNGTSCIDSLDQFRKVGIGGQKADAYMAFSPQSKVQFQQAISLFGGAYLAVALPASAQHQIVWDVPKHVPFWQRHLWQPYSWGGHCVWLTDYNSQGPICITWGGKKQITWSWLFAYCVESYAVYTKHWIAGPNGISPSQLDEATLMRDMQALTQAA